MAITLEKAVKWSEILSVFSQVVIAVSAGIWAYHWHDITGDSEMDPSVTLTTETRPYSDPNSLVVVHIHMRNAGKVPVRLENGSLILTIKCIPDGLRVPTMQDPDNLKIYVQSDNILGKYVGYEIQPGDAESDEIQTAVLPHGEYYVDAELTWFDHGKNESAAHQIVSIK